MVVENPYGDKTAKPLIGHAFTKLAGRDVCGVGRKVRKKRA